jgi:hypothetical protein
MTTKKTLKNPEASTSTNKRLTLNKKTLADLTVPGQGPVGGVRSDDPCSARASGCTH